MRALVVIAHPDDETLCGGLIRKITAAGGKVFIVCFSGSSQRKKEFMDSCHVLGAEGTCLDYMELSLETSLDYDSFISLKNTILKFKPDIIITLSWNDYHPDHRAVSRITMKAAEFASHGTHNSGWLPSRILSFEANTLIPDPDFLVDISKEFDCKMRALKKHSSQLKAEHKKGYYIALTAKRAELRGVQGGCRYAEAYSEVRMPVHGNFYCKDRTIRDVSSLLKR
ncbi:MAG: PIG-L family deacetylase [Nanoarchaeota archaeon]|nr:PIG-L family deacetylase [Nanoarchaeota archaeon]